MNLIIDIGNTRTKMAVFDSGKAVYERVAANSLEDELMQITARYTSIGRTIISSVAEEPERLMELLVKKEIDVKLLNEETKLPFANCYKTPETLGKDRIAAVAGATNLFPNQPVLVIDAGTAITFDFKDAQNKYLGGNISPGLTMRFKALHQYTAKLPLLESKSTKNYLGLSTQEAIINGVQNGLVFEVDGYIERFEAEQKNLVVILTGGDAHFFDNKLKKTIFVVSNLTLQGLNTILEYNV